MWIHIQLVCNIWLTLFSKPLWCCRLTSIIHTPPILNSRIRIKVRYKIRIRVSHYLYNSLWCFVIKKKKFNNVLNTFLLRFMSVLDRELWKKPVAHWLRSYCFVSDVVAYSELAVRQNAAIIDYCRTSMSALSGATAGILGLTALYGFAFYFITAFLLSVRHKCYF